MKMAPEKPGDAFDRLLEIMAQLRAPDGCPWDLEQDWNSLRRYTLEEAYEVVDTIDRRDFEALPGELGDLLLQVVFLAQIGSEEKRFSAADVIASISDKLVRRHPHVFGEEQAADADEVLRNWEAIKHRERGEGSLLDDVPRSLPALDRAQKLAKRAAQIDFDWPDAATVVAKVHEELAELEAALADDDRAAIEDELGDLLFAVTNLSRKVGLSAEVSLNAASAKFERRFRRVEAAVRDGRVAATLEDMDAEWERVKADERAR